MFGRWIEDQRMLAWIIFTVFVSTSARTIFKSSTNLTNLVMDERTGELYAGATNFIYKLDNKLDMIGKANTTCIISCPDGSQKLGNINQILLLDNFFNGRGLLACGTSGGGTCAILNISTLTPYARSETRGIVSNTMKYPSVALFDPANQEILISSTRLIDPRTGFVRTPDLAAYRLNKEKLVVKLSARLYLSRQRPKTTVIAGVIVGEYRYFFTVSGDGSRIVRLCKSYKNDQSIITYVEMPLFCAGSNGEKFEHLHKVKVVLPGSKLAKAFGISVNDSVVVGVFMKSETAFESAVCVYSFQQINNLFWRNIEKCLTASLADKLLRNEYQPNYCVTESPITNCIPAGEYKNQIIIGRIHCKGNAILTCSTCHLSSSLDVTVYRNNTIAFIGTRSGKLAKVLISSNSSGTMYELSSRIPGSSILSVNLQPNGTHVYMMTSDKIVKIPVHECNDRKTCESCVGNGDPYCGWCTLFAKCTIQSECPYASHHLGYVQASSQCINISNIHPRELPLSKRHHHKVNISIVNLPPRNPRDSYNCHINGINVTSAWMDDTTLECFTPLSSQLPRVSFQTGGVSVEVAVYSAETEIKIVYTMMKFYNCSAISNCLNCTTGSLACSWCNYEARCIGDENVSAFCPDSFVPWVGTASSHRCPLLKSQTINIPASIEREIVVSAMQLPEPSNGEYKCVLNVDGAEFNSSATRNNATSLTCRRTEYKYSPETKTFPARLQILLGRSVIESGGDVTVTLYKCHVPAKDCGSCLGEWESQYQCGWCPKSACVVRDGCKTEDWVDPYGTCSAIPEITWFYPETGPVAGNTTLEINGTELGSKFEDVKNVSIGDVPCHAVKAKYIISRRIVCRTSRSYKGPFSDKIKVIISEKVGYSTKFFRYQEPVVVDFEPKVGLVSGGTLLKITGKHLNTGRYIKVTVGRSPCHNIRLNPTFITCKTSPHNTRRRRSSDGVKTESLVVTFDGSAPESLPTETFTYVPDPIITDITPLYTFPSSEVPLTVTGTNLYAIQNRQIVLQFKSRRFQNVCGKATKSQSQMICELPDVSPVSENDNKANISLVLDDVTRWRDLSGYSFNSIEFVPDPHIIAFNKEKGKEDEEVRILSGDALQITGSNLEAQVDPNLIQFVITVGGQLCNITAKVKDVIYCKPPKQSSLPKQESYDVVVNVTSSRLSFNVGKVKFPIVTTTSSKDDRSVMYIIIGVCGTVLIVFLSLMVCMYRRMKKQRQKERTLELQMNMLELEVEESRQEDRPAASNTLPLVNRMARNPRMSNSGEEDVVMETGSSDKRIFETPVGEYEILPDECEDSESENESNGEKWELKREQIKIEKVIGKGSFGQVAKGLLSLKTNEVSEEQIVAIKMVKENCADSDKNDLLSELHIMKSLGKHPNVIYLLGCVTKTEPLLAVIAFVPFGDLLGYLRKSRGQHDNYFNDPDIKPKTNLSSRELIRFARDVACGMEFLAINKVVHRDLAARNVLVGEELVCKITDFGMARDVYRDNIYTKTSKGRIPVKWTAYESLMYNKYTTQSDVWSYGVLLFEIFTIGGTPYPGIKGRDVYSLIKNGYRMEKPAHLNENLYSVMLNCWKTEPEERPSFLCLKNNMAEIEMGDEEYVNIGEYDSSLYEDSENFE